MSVSIIITLINGITLIIFDLRKDGSADESTYRRTEKDL